jgi:hypothetical protein
MPEIPRPWIEPLGQGDVHNSAAAEFGHAKGCRSVRSLRLPDERHGWQVTLNAIVRSAIAPTLTDSGISLRFVIGSALYVRSLR